MPVELLGKSAEELREYVTTLGEKPFRAAQLYHALYAERRFEFAAMTNIPAALRARLAQETRITPPRIARRFPSVDGSFYYVGGVGINYQQRDKIILAPIRLGVGLRAGASIGYMHYTKSKTVNPF